MARDKKIPLHLALDHIAIGEGFRCWSHLSDQHSELPSVGALYARLAPGDLVISAARPGQGKTLLALALAIEAMKKGRRALFFSLDYTEMDMIDRFRALDASPADFQDLFRFDGSDCISAAYMRTRMTDVPEGTLAVVD